MSRGGRTMDSAGKRTVAVLLPSLVRYHRGELQETSGESRGELSSGRSLGLTRFRGHLNSWDERSPRCHRHVHPMRRSSGNRWSNKPGRTLAGRAGPGVRTVGAGDPQLARQGRSRFRPARRRADQRRARRARPVQAGEPPAAPGTGDLANAAAWFARETGSIPQKSDGGSSSS